MSADLMLYRDRVVAVDLGGPLPRYQVTCRGCELPAISPVPLSRPLCMMCTLNRFLADAPRKGFWLYRLWSKDDRLLYVGITRHPRARLRSHWWKWHRVLDHSTWEECLDELDMLDREARAIDSEYPALNFAHPEPQL